jgi:glycerol-3-phosphate dehydrogenase
MHARARQLESLTARVFDALIIGGGITGAGIARDAAMRGLSVALIDKGDFASGTSSRSSRLIHGGVRYLEHGHLHLVFEASAERRRLLRLAPHLVQPLAFTWPIYEGQRLPVWKLAAGLTLYDLLAMFRNVARHRRLSPAQVLQFEPRLESHRLRGGVHYFDAATNDARLALTNVLDAQARGAVVANHVALMGVAPTLDAVRVARVSDALTGTHMEVRAHWFVNATGPWSDAVREIESGATTAHVQGSKGAHVAVPRERLDNRDAVTLLHPRDGRVMFVLPAREHAIIGTTDTFTSVSPDSVRANESDVAYLLDAANTAFPAARLKRDDIISAWAGIRPLMPTTGSSVAATREHAIQRGEGTITITGGKLTTYRLMARELVDVLEVALGRKHTRARTDVEPLPDSAADALPVTSGAPAVQVGLPYRMDDLRRGVEEELACTLGDLLIRRTRVAFETRDNGRAAAHRIVDFVAPLLGWSAGQRDREVERYDAEVTRIFTIDP